MNVSKKFIIIWSGIGLPVGIITSIKTRNYIIKSTTSDIKNNNYNKVIKNIAFITWVSGIGIIYGIIWPFTYPILINNYIGKENNEYTHFCER